MKLLDLILTKLKHLRCDALDHPYNQVLSLKLPPEPGYIFARVWCQYCQRSTFDYSRRLKQNYRVRNG